MGAPPGGSPVAPALAPGEDLQRQGLRVICRGVVQGVGFRPAVARLAASLGLEGQLSNIPAAVRLELAGSRPALERFLEQLPAALPRAARLEGLQSEWLPPPLPADLAEGTGLRISAATPRPLRIGLVAPSLVADRAPCAMCRIELGNPHDRRFCDPFISCCSCGPRYSIASAEPYSRAHTTLAGFPLCATCQAEFDDPANRRFHAETIGCPACGPQLRLLDVSGATANALATANGLATASALATARALAAAVKLLRSGQILALQGVGGFQLLVNATDAEAVARLRARKRRPHKPFALLIDNLERLAGLVHPSAAERTALEDPAAPIVLLPCPDGAHETVLQGVAPGAPGLGVMLPASPLHQLLAETMAGPLVATSGNRSGEPLCIDPTEALERLSGIADAFLVHDRPIARPLDDSVLQVIDGRPALLRRSRGYAPEALTLARSHSLQPTGGTTPARIDGAASRAPARPLPESARIPDAVTDPARADGHDPLLLALGSDLKSAPALAIGDRLWLAPHGGDLADSRCLERWRAGINELLGLQRGRPVAVAMDGHPEYLSAQLAGPLLQGTVADCLPPHPVAHHRAHGLAVAAEHALLLPLPALVLDGLGYGGGPVPLWGCELLRLEPGGASRLASLRPFPLPGGERAVREPRRSALGLLWASQLLEHPGAAAVGAAFSAEERRLLSQAMAAGCNSPWCSSAGRLFDAVAALLDLVQVASHDAHAGLLLQAAAGRAPSHAGAYPLPVQAPPSPWSGPAAPGVNDENQMPLLDWQPLLSALLDDIAAGEPPELCAARFHGGLIEGLADAVASLAGPDSDPHARRSEQDRGLPVQGTANQNPERRNPTTPSLVLAGGCFQNRLLLEGLIQALRHRGWSPHWGEQLPANDGGLAVGQIMALQQVNTRSAPQAYNRTAACRIPHVPGDLRSHSGDHPPAA